MAGLISKQGAAAALCGVNSDRQAVAKGFCWAEMPSGSASPISPNNRASLDNHFRPRTQDLDR